MNDEYIRLQRCQHKKVADKWDFNSCVGQHGEGVYAFFSDDKKMIDYYSSNGENLYTFKIPKKYIKFLNRKLMDFWEAKTYITNHPEYKAFVFKHKGYDIPTSLEVVITDANIIQIKE